MGIRKDGSVVHSISKARSVFSDNFQFGFDDIPEDMPENIEKDRLIMSARQGMMRKIFGINKEEAGLFSSGYYLFDNYENATKFKEWIENDFVIDGVKFLDQPFILNPSIQMWHIAAADDFAPSDEKQKVVRIQRWNVPETIDPDQLREKWWNTLRKEAIEHDLTSAWLLAGTEGDQAQLGVLLAADGTPSEVNDSSASSIKRLENWVAPGERIAKAYNGTKVFDKTSWIYMVWHGIEAGDSSPDTAQWPISPPLPGL